MNKPSRQFRRPEQSRGMRGEQVSPLFRLGDESLNQERLVDGRRLLTWDVNGKEGLVAAQAGWADFSYFIHDEKCTLEIPHDTRSARSVLSGIEAWAGEKQAIVEHVARYLNEAQKILGPEDVIFSWSQVGITPDRHIFVAPPNAAGDGEQRNGHEIFHVITQDLDALLSMDIHNKYLVNYFAQSISGEPHNAD